MRGAKPLIVAIFIAVLAGCASFNSAQPPLPDNVAWVVEGSEWGQQAEQTYQQASRYVAGVDLPPGTEWVVVLDIDETVLSNITYQLELIAKGETYSSESWHQWTRRQEATLVPGAAEFIRLVNAKGGHVALVTNRRDYEQLATEANLHKVGLRRGQDFQILLTRATPKGISNKMPRFQLVPQMLAAQGYANAVIIAYVGDNVNDHPPAPDETAFFCINQGAIYGDPCAPWPPQK